MGMWEEILNRTYQIDRLDLKGFLSDDELKEDFGIIHPDGSRACISFELRDKGFHIDPYLRR